MKVKEGLVLSEIGDDYVVVPVGTEYDNFQGVIQLNYTGAEIWKCIEAGMSRDEIAEHLVTKFTKIDKEGALKSVTRVVDLLIREGFVEE